MRGGSVASVEDKPAAFVLVILYPQNNSKCFLAVHLDVVLHSVPSLGSRKRRRTPG